MSAPDAVVSTVPMELDTRLDTRLLAQVFRRTGRLHIPGILAAESALQAHRWLVEDTPWTLHFNDGETRHYDLPLEQYEALTLEQRQAFLAPLYARANAGFQYLYDYFPLSDHYDRDEHRERGLMALLEWLRSPAFLGFARAVTGLPDIVTADAQATRYRAGHFLTAHDDLDEVKGRLAAYVLNLTPRWRADLGGTLQFIDADGHVAEGFVPGFNALNVFRVPALHCVSAVAPFALEGRYSITGWLRSR